MIARGLDNRRKRHHQLNSDSSRSHAIFSVYLDAAEVGSDGDGGGEGGGAVRYGRISLCDLAGSENVRASGSQGVGLKEAGSINKSLFALGQVIKALAAEGLGRRVAHVPYRDATLTKLLSDSLGGNAMSLMIACCTPQLSYVEESLRTVHYACTAGAIRNRPSVKLDPQEQLILYLTKEVRELKQRVQQLTSQLDASHRRLASHGLVSSREGSPSGSGVPSSRDDDSDALTDRPRSRPPSRGLVTVDRPRASMPPSRPAPPRRLGRHAIPTVTISLGDLTGGASAPSARKPSVRETLRAAVPLRPSCAGRPHHRRSDRQARPASGAAVRLTREGRRAGRRRRRVGGGGSPRGEPARASSGGAQLSKCRRAAVVAPRPQRRRRRQRQRRQRRRQWRRRRRQRRRRWRAY